MADGSLHWLATNGRMFFDAQGEPFRMGRIHYRRHAPKLAEEDLRRSEASSRSQHLSSTGSFSWRVATDESFGQSSSIASTSLRSACPLRSN